MLTSFQGQLSKSNSPVSLPIYPIPPKSSIFPSKLSLKKKAILKKKSNRASIKIKYPLKSHFFIKDSTQINDASNNLKPEIQRPINLLNNILSLIKVANILRFKSSLRPLKFINEKQIEYINDQTYFNDGKARSHEFLKRFTEKNIFRKLYFLMMSFLEPNFRFCCSFTKHLQTIISSIPIIKPDQKGKVLWDVLILLTIIFYFFIIPLQISFDFYYDEEIMTILNSLQSSSFLSQFIILIPEILLIIDTIMKLFTGFYKNGIVITEKSEIISHYLRKGLFFDMLSYSPILAQPYFKTTSFGGLFLKFFQLLMFCKLKRVKIIMSNFQEIISLKGKHDHALKLLILVYKIVLFSHLMACLWHAVAYYNTQGDSWLDMLGLRQTSINVRYCKSLYWSVSVLLTISYGQIFPQNSSEYGLGVMIFLISALFLGYTMHSMREIFTLLEKNEKIYKENLSVINNLMQRNNVAFELQGRVRKYLEYISHQESNPEKEAEILNKLTNTLRKEVVLAVNAKHLFTLPFFSQNFSAETLEELSHCLRKVRFSPEEFIYQKNQKDDLSLFLIETGTLETLPEVQKSQKFLNIGLQNSGIIGSYSFFTEEPRENSIQSRNFSTLFELKKVDFMAILRKKPEDLQKYFMIRDQMKIYSLSTNNSTNQCESCGKQNHNFLICPTVHFLPDHEFLIKKSAFSQPQQRIFLHRRIKKLNTLVLLQIIQQKAQNVNESMSISPDDIEKDEEIKNFGTPLHNDNSNFRDKDFGSFEEIKTFGGPLLHENSHFKDKDFFSFVENEDALEKKNESSIINEIDDQLEKSISSKKYPSIIGHMVQNQENQNQEFLINSNNQENRRFTPKPIRAISINDKKLLSNQNHQDKGSSTSINNKIDNLSYVNVNKNETFRQEKILVSEPQTLFILDFDEAKNYMNYFPDGNMDKVIEKLNKRILLMSMSSPSVIKHRHYRRAAFRSPKGKSLGIDKKGMLINSFPAKTE